MKILVAALCQIVVAVNIKYKEFAGSVDQLGGYLSVAEPLPAFLFQQDSFDDWLSQVKSHCRAQIQVPLAKKHMAHFSMAQSNCIVFGKRLQMLRLFEQNDNVRMSDSVRATNTMRHGHFYVSLNGVMTILNMLNSDIQLAQTIKHAFCISQIHILLSYEVSTISKSVQQFVHYISTNAPHIFITFSFTDYAWNVNVRLKFINRGRKCQIESQHVMQKPFNFMDNQIRLNAMLTSALMFSQQDRVLNVYNKTYTLHYQDGNCRPGAEIIYTDDFRVMFNDMTPVSTVRLQVADESNVTRAINVFERVMNALVTQRSSFHEVVISVHASAEAKELITATQMRLNLDAYDLKFAQLYQVTKLIDPWHMFTSELLNMRILGHLGFTVLDNKAMDVLISQLDNVVQNATIKISVGNNYFEQSAFCFGIGRIIKLLSQRPFVERLQLYLWRDTLLYDQRADAVRDLFTDDLLFAVPWLSVEIFAPFGYHPITYRAYRINSLPQSLGDQLVAPSSWH